MREYVCEALVLSREGAGEVDSHINLLTHEYGKVSARARSARKISSRLSAHLEPGTLSLVRLVEKKGIQITDALLIRKLNLDQLALHQLETLLATGEPEETVWTALTTAKTMPWQSILASLGWEDTHATCFSCGQATPDGFFIPHLAFLCVQCRDGSRLPLHSVEYISLTTL